MKSVEENEMRKKQKYCSIVIMISQLKISYAHILRMVTSIWDKYPIQLL